MNVSKSIAKGLSEPADISSVGLQTMVLWNPSSSTFGSLSKVAAGDSVVGGLNGPSAGSVEPTSKALTDLPPSSSAASARSRQTERRALETLRREKAKLGRHRDKHRDHR